MAHGTAAFQFFVRVRVAQGAGILTLVELRDATVVVVVALHLSVFFSLCGEGIAHGHHGLCLGPTGGLVHGLGQRFEFGHRLQKLLFVGELRGSGIVPGGRFPPCQHLLELAQTFGLLRENAVCQRGFQLRKRGKIQDRINESVPCGVPVQI